MGEVTVRPYLCASSLKIGVLRVCVYTPEHGDRWSLFM